MKNAKITIFFALTAVLLPIFMSEAGKKSAIRFSEDVVRALSGVQSVGGTMKISYNAHDFDFEESLKDDDPGATEAVSDFEWVRKPDPVLHYIKKYTISENNLSPESKSHVMNTEGYCVKNKNRYENYMEAEGQWMKLDATEKMTPSLYFLSEDGLFKQIKDGKIKSKLDGKAHKVKEKELFLLKATLEGDDLIKLLSPMVNVQANTSANMKEKKDLKSSASIYIDKKTRLPVSIKIKPAGKPQVSFKVVLDGYNDVPSIKIPKEVSENVSVFSDHDMTKINDYIRKMDPARIDNQENESGTYSILGVLNKKVVANIGVPKGFECIMSNDLMLRMQKVVPDQNYSILYSYAIGKNPDEMSEEGKTHIPEFKKSDRNVKITEEKILSINGMDVHYIVTTFQRKGNNHMDAYAWTESTSGTPFTISLLSYAYKDADMMDIEKILEIVFQNVHFTGVSYES